MQENERDFFSRLCIMAVVTAFVFVTLFSFAERPTLPTVNSVPVQINFGFKAVATPTFEVNDETPVTLNDYLPYDTMGFEIRSESGAFVIGHPDNIATGSSRVGRLISIGETYTWKGLAGTFNGVVLSNDVGSATIVIDAAWGDW